MRKRMAALLLALLMLAGCGAKESPSTERVPQIAPEAETNEPVILYDCGTVQIALPMEYKKDLIVKRGAEDCEADRPLYPRMLLSVYEKASVEAAEADSGNADGVGFLWGFSELDEAALEALLETMPGGCTVFAEKDGLYYAYLTPTDVQFHRSDLSEFTPESEDFKHRERLNQLGETVREDMVTRNGLARFTPEPVPTQAPPEDAPVDQPPAAAPETIAAAAMAGKLTVYNCSGVKIALPAEYLPLLLLEGGDHTTQHACSLLSVREKASVEAAKADYGDAEGVGFLFGIRVMDQAGFEQFVQYETAGCDVFARSDTHYYAKTHPTDVQFYRSGGVINTADEDWQMWETLNALGDAVCADFTERNGLMPYSIQELWAQPFTWEGNHAYAKYYPYHSFDGSTAEFRTLVLSQPAAQGEGGVWCVERVVDSFGNTYLRFPETDLAAADYYTALQAECDDGEHPELLTPLGAAAAFIEAHYEETATEENLVLTDGVDGDYSQTNRLMGEVISALLVRPETVSDEQLLGCVSQFRSDTWGVLGRTYYGSDWWPPLRAALERAAVGEKQTDRTRALIHFYLVSYGQYADFLAACLQRQQQAAPAVFEAVLSERSHAEQALLRSALE